MNVPISATVLEDKILINHNSKTTQIPLPFKPFMMLEAEHFPEIKCNDLEIWTKVPNNEEKAYIRINFGTIDDFQTFRKHNSDRNKYILANQYLEQLYISRPDFFKDYPHTNKLRVLFYDIEVATKGDGLFPKPINNEILCIGYSVWDYLVDGSKVKIAHHLCKDYDEENASDEKIILNFFKGIEDYDPDIIADYYGSQFDFPYIGERCEINQIDTSQISRGNKKPYLEKGKIYIPGRIHFDILSSNSGVVKDQTLYGIKDRTLKTLARFYKSKKTILKDNEWVEEPLDDIELPGEIENLLKLYRENPERLFSYQDADVYRTESVGHVYIRNCITLAEMIGVPLNSIMNMYSSFVPKIFVARSYEKERLINTETNFQRYNIKNGSLFKLGTKYEGAVVGLYKDGYFDSTWKLDFASQYPSAAQTFNLGPDTTQLMEVKEYNEFNYSCVKDSKWTWYEIPTKFDKGKYSYNFIIRVRNDKEGFLKRDIKQLREARTEIKREMKKASGDERAALHSQQVAIKVILNSIYGFLGLKTSIYGDMISACMITAMCRWNILKCMQRNEECLVETDSVTGNTPIYVFNSETNELDIIPIEDLHNSNKKRLKYNGKYKVLTRNGWKDIYYTKKHLVNKNIHRIKISDGYVDVTEDHSLFDYESKKELTPKAIEINKSKIETTDDPINRCKLFYGELVESSDFCWLIGFFIAEGSAYEGKNKHGVSKRQISFNGNDLNLMKKVEKLANKYLSNIALDTRDIKKPHKFKLHNTLKSSAVYKVQGGYNKLIVDWFKTVCYTKNRKDKKVPAFILNGTDEMKKSFLDGLMAGDGYIAINNGRKCESLDSKFKSLSAGVRFLWNNLGYKTTCAIRKDKENITTYKKRHSYKTGKLKEIDKNIVTINTSKLTEEYVYDISTKDGTFVTALGNIVLHNTDGIVVDKFIDADIENKWLNKELQNKFFIEDNYMELELEGDGERAWFYAMKNYVMENGPGDYIIHGSSMKSSRAAPVVDRAINLGIEHVFNGLSEEEVNEQAYDFRECTLEDFTERLKLSKEQNEYDDATDFHIFLAKQVEMKTGQVITKDTQISYVVTKDKLPFIEFKPFQKGGKNYTFIKLVDNIEQIDINYYSELVEKALSKFGVKRYKQFSLFPSDEIKPIRDTKLDKVPNAKL